LQVFLCPAQRFIYTPSVIGMISFVEENGGQHFQGVPIEALATCVAPTAKQTYFHFNHIQNFRPL